MLLFCVVFISRNINLTFSFVLIYENKTEISKIIFSAKIDLRPIENKKRLEHRCTVAYEGQAVFLNDSYFKSEFHFHVQFEFKN